MLYLTPMRQGRILSRIAIVAAAAGGGFLPVAEASSISLVSLGSAYTQDFNTLAASGTGNTFVPTGWYFLESGSGLDFAYRADDGDDNAGDTYSYGQAGDAERAWGALGSLALTPTIGALFVNNTGATIDGLAVTFVGEQWRLGTNTAGRSPDRLEFQYSTDALSLASGTWTDVNALDFSSPTITGTVGALNGNAAANAALLSFSIAGLSIADGATFWLRWNEFNVSGADDGLAIDDFSLTPVSAVPAPGALGLLATAMAALGGHLRRRRRPGQAFAA